MNDEYKPDDYQIKDSGTRRSFSTGAVRDGEVGKGRFDLLPYEGLMVAARQFEAGAKKYAARNWEKGMPLSVYADSMARHLYRWVAGLKDEDHLAAALWNALAAATIRERVKSGLLPK